MHTLMRLETAIYQLMLPCTDVIFLETFLLILRDMPDNTMLLLTTLDTVPLAEALLLESL